MKNIEIAENGGGQYFIPKRCELINKTNLTMLKKSQEVEKKLKRTYSGKQTKFDDEAQAIMTAFNITILHSTSTAAAECQLTLFSSMGAKSCHGLFGHRYPRDERGWCY